MSPDRRPPGRLGEILDLVAATHDPGERAEVLLALADRFREVPPEVARRPFSPANLVPACESEAYVWGLLQPDGRLVLHFAVENPSGISAKALAAALTHGLSGQPASEVARVDPDVVFDLFRRDISMGKGLGLMSMVKAVKAIAARAADLADKPPGSTAAPAPGSDHSCS